MAKLLSITKGLQDSRQTKVVYEAFQFFIALFSCPKKSYSLACFGLGHVSSGMVACWWVS